VFLTDEEMVHACAAMLAQAAEGGQGLVELIEDLAEPARKDMLVLMTTLAVNALQFTQEATAEETLAGLRRWLSLAALDRRFLSEDAPFREVPVWR